MTQNHIILIFFIELTIFYLIFYLIFTANRWVNTKKEEVDGLLLDLPEAIKSFRREIKQFNKKITSQDSMNPLTVTEIGNLVGEVAVELMKSRIPFPIGNKLPIIPIVMKLWKYRNRFQATIKNQTAKL